MDDKKIRAKYGGKLPKAINRAIRAEVKGGSQALDHMTALAGAARQSGWKDRQGRNTEEAAAYFRYQREVIDPMDAEVRKRWGLPPELRSEKTTAAVKKPTGPRKARPRKLGPKKTRARKE
jgi:hypothetical protein